MSSGVEFDTDMQTRPKSYYQGGSVAAGPRGGGMSGWLVRKGWADNEQQAQAYLAAVILINIVATFFVLYKYVL